MTNRRRQVLCESCGTLRLSALRDCNICGPCHRKEPPTLCARCNSKRYQVSRETGLCPTCSKFTERLNNITVGEQRRVITCEICGHYSYTYFKSRDVCPSCHDKEVSVTCERCKRRTHLAARDTGLCPKCTQINARPIGTCSDCSEVAVLFDSVNRRCKSCHIRSRRRARYKLVKKKVICSQCGELRVTVLARRNLCLACDQKKRNGVAECSKCHRVKSIKHRKDKLCSRCYQNRIASKALRKYVTNYTSRYLYNKLLFDVFVTSINWEAVTERGNQGTRRFGRFLQQHEFIEPLSWEQIAEAMPELLRNNRGIPKDIRARLIILGHILAKKNQLESYESYRRRQYAFQPLERAPEEIRDVLRRHANWLIGKRKNTLLRVRNCLQILVSFWSWCQPHGIKRPEEVQPSLIKEFVLTRYWWWKCSDCGNTSEPTSQGQQAPAQCEQCGVRQRISKVRKASQETVRHYNSGLKVFFEWCKLNKLILVNPVQSAIPPARPVLQHYSIETVKKLMAYVVNPDADPTEALMLYLIIAYGLSNWELRHAQIPEAIPAGENSGRKSLAELYHIMIPEQPPSRGKRSPGRPERILEFRSKDEYWLKPLLERFESQRQQILKDKRNLFLFIVFRRSQQTAISNMSIARIIKLASTRVLGAVCNASTLRKTSGIIFADQVGSSILPWMGWSPSAATSYELVDRKEIHPKKIANSSPI